MFPLPLPPLVSKVKGFDDKNQIYAGWADSCHYGFNCIFGLLDEHAMVCWECFRLEVFLKTPFVAFGRLWSSWRPFSGFLSVYALPVSSVYTDRTLSYENATPRWCFFKETLPIGGVFTDKARFGLIYFVFSLNVFRLVPWWVEDPFRACLYILESSWAWKCGDYD